MKNKANRFPKTKEEVPVFNSNEEATKAGLKPGDVYFAGTQSIQTTKDTVVKVI
jgi:hypothetical protein